MAEQQHDDPTPEGFFKLEEITTFGTLEGEQLADINYYFWLPVKTAAERFLLYLEILFTSGNALILTSGEESDALRVTDAQILIEHARLLKARNNGQPAVRQLNANASALWQPALGQDVLGVRLSKEQTSGLYLNDALLLQMGDTGIVVALHPKGGISVSPQL